MLNPEKIAEMIPEDPYGGDPKVSLPGVGKYNPRRGEQWILKPLPSTPDTHEYKVDGRFGRTVVNGELTIYLKDGEYDGYDWEGQPVGPDELQAILDGLETAYPGSGGSVR